MSRIPAPGGAAGFAGATAASRGPRVLPAELGAGGCFSGLHADWAPGLLALSKILSEL